MFEALKKKKERYLMLEKELSSPELLSNRALYKERAKEYAQLKELVNSYDRYMILDEERKSLEKMIEDEGSGSEYAILAQKELFEVNAASEVKKKALEMLLLDDEAADLDKNVIVEIRAGTGGVEASLFAADLFKMYSKYIAQRGWKISMLNLSEGDLGGIKEIVFAVEGQRVFKFLRFEMGTHRVQRVPETESGGRIHTSAATVAVLPEAEDVDIDIDPQDLRIDFYRSSGAGGQHVNVTDSAVRITHIPTGIVSSCQDERSQHKNKAKAMRMLKVRFVERKESEQRQKISEQRRNQVGSGDRSEKIRTYNFPENRITDHRIKVSLYNLVNILEGEMDELIEALLDEDRKLRLQFVS